MSSLTFFIFTCLFALDSVLAFSSIAPKTTSKSLSEVQSLLDEVYGSFDSEEWSQRRSEARSFGLSRKDESFQDGDTASSILENIPQHELVYGELGLDSLVTILDAVGVEKGDNFMDIGAGDGMLVTGASLLYSDYLQSSRGVEIVPNLYERSIKFYEELETKVEKSDNMTLCPETKLSLGNCYKPDKELKKQFAETTLAVCFATTWSRGIDGRKLDRLSEALGHEGASALPKDARLVIIDGVLNPKKDGYAYEGELKLQCIDTAPYSIARLYRRV
ncbi:hypothetical protein CTEN210_04946 [Chaetoceros tenuissimus]|uniref:DOT1 domain-containing protein n=1 Tax=Chaetoceros tenuissimus TaxID=426638 RepID=A0AAD3H2Z4_9STRA|nr:hypothetical protein CTEN210_04946 [Chaetoceros tenuissimus]